MLVDASSRPIRHIRISVTDRCQLRCRYCLPEEGAPLMPHEAILRHEEILAFMAVAVEQGITSVRLTGGEPLMRRGLLGLVRGLAELKGLDDLSLTTNGLLLPDFAQPLKDAGLNRINLGISSLDPEGYRTLTRGGDLGQALKGLQAALDTGFAPVKVNVVLLKGFSDDPAPFLDLTQRLPVELRFIEYMPLGPEDHGTNFISMAELQTRLEAFGPFEEIAPAFGFGPAQQARRIPGAPGSFAVIPASSGHFCERCNRLRLTSDGHLRLCLFSGEELDLKPALRPSPDPEALRAVLRRAIGGKPASKRDATGEFGRRMSQIGG